jgi:hypothetical protein
VERSIPTVLCWFVLTTSDPHQSLTHLAVLVLEYRKKFLKTTRLHAQIAECRLHSAKDLVCFQQPDLITGQRWVWEQLK